MHPADALDRLRTHRNAPDPDLSLTALIGKERRRHRSDQRAAGGIGEAWERVVPPALAEKAVVVRCRRGVLTLRVRDASAMYRINQWLASGGLSTLREASGRGITRVAFMHA